MCQDPRRLLTPAADTNKHEQQRSAPDLCGRSTEAQGPLVDVDRPRDRPDRDEARPQSLYAFWGAVLIRWTAPHWLNLAMGHAGLRESAPVDVAAY